QRAVWLSRALLLVSWTHPEGRRAAGSDERDEPPRRHAGHPGRGAHARSRTSVRARPPLPGRSVTRATRKPPMRIAMIGSGYVGLVSGACFADFGHVVCCIDTDAGKIAALMQGQMPIFEPGLAELVASCTREQRLSFTTDLTPALRSAEVVFIAVGTPSRAADGLADLSDVYQAARQMAPLLDGYKVIVTKSTVPVGTGDEIARIIGAMRP